MVEVDFELKLRNWNYILAILIQQTKNRLTTSLSAKE